MNTMISYTELDRMLVEYKIDLFRFDSHVNRELMRVITENNPKIKALILSINKKTTKAEVNRIVREIKGVSKEMFLEAYGKLHTEWNGLYTVSNAIEVAIYNEFSRSKLFKATNTSMKLPEIDGISFDEWWKRTESAHNWRLEKLSKGLRAGTIPEENYAGIYQKAIRQTRQNVKNLVRTSNAVIAGESRDRMEKENSDLFEYKQHLSTLDGRTTPICRARDLLMWDLNNEPIGHNFEFLQPPLHFGCRSIIRLIVKGRNKRFSTRASQFGQVDETLDYNSWLKQQSPTYQNKILGKARAELFRSGNITVRDLVNQDGRALTLEQLKAKYNVI